MFFITTRYDGYEDEHGYDVVLSKDIIVFELKSDGTAVLTEKRYGESWTKEFTWKLNEEDETKVEITIDYYEDGEDVETLTATRDGDKLIMVGEDDDDTIITLKK